MNKSERTIYLERMMAENNQRRLTAMKRKAEHERIERSIETIVSMLQVWSAYNIAVMFSYRGAAIQPEPSLDRQSTK